MKIPKAHGGGKQDEYDSLVPVPLGKLPVMEQLSVDLCLAVPCPASVEIIHVVRSPLNAVPVKAEASSQEPLARSPVRERPTVKMSNK